MPPELTTFFLGMTPVGEIRAAIIWGMNWGKLSSAEALFWGFLGNILVAILIILFLPKIAEFARRNFRTLDGILQKIFARTRKQHSRNFSRFAELFLLVLVAIPLPGSGAWTGALVAWLFGVEKKVAIPLISAGILIAGFVILGIMNGGTTLFRQF